MSMTQALSNALSGLTASSRGTEIVAANLANAMTPGYAKRELSLVAQNLGGRGGGVRIEGVARIVNASLLGESRLAEAGRADAAVRLTFARSMESVIGVAGQPGGIGAALTDLQTALLSAASRPDDDLRLSQIVLTAGTLARQLNDASVAVQKSRTAADQAIAADITSLTSGLDQVAKLNHRIAVLEADGNDPSALIDARQKAINAIARIVPLQEVARGNGTVALFTKEGGVLLDGSQPTDVSFVMSGSLTVDKSVEAGQLSRLYQNGAQLTAGQMRLFAGGSLAANFAVRDELAPQVQRELDAIAFELQGRFASNDVDPSLTPTAPGLFTDQGERPDISDIAGLAGRIGLNDAVRPEAGGDLWRLRAGIGAIIAGPVGDASLLGAMGDALASAQTPPNGEFRGVSTMAARLAQLEARIATRRVNAESDTAARNALADTMASRMAADGVDSDAELQRLLQYEQAYAANAKVIQTIEDMMDQLLRL